MRTAVQSLQVVSGFDVRENAALGTADYNCMAGVLTKVTGAPVRAGYYCRSAYNPTASSVTVVYRVFDDLATYTAVIPSGQWFHCYGNIQVILGSGTTEATVVLAYSSRGKVDGTGN